MGADLKPKRLSARMHEPTGPLRERTGVAVGASRTAAWARPARALAASLVAAVFLSLSGAFGSGDAPLIPRLLYWVVLMVAGGLLGGAATRLVERREWAEERPWLRATLIATLVTAPLVFVVWAATAWWFGKPLRPAALPEFIVPVALVAALMTAANFALNRTPVQTHEGPSGAPEPRFLERLPFKLRGAELHAVEAEDHYLRLHTSRGSDLILMRLSDALAELEGLEGAQTHRSWWVARDAVAEARPSDGRAVLKLKSGAEAPVSRTYAKALREAGWF